MTSVSHKAKKTGLVLLTTGLIFFGATALAVTNDATKSKTPNTPATKVTTTKTNSDALKVGAKILEVQEFINGPLHIEFRYVNQKLTYIRFLNISDKAFEVEFLGKTTILGPNDAMVFNPPNLSHLFYTVTPYSGVPSILTAQILKNRFQQIFVFRLPPNVDSKVSY